MSSSPTTELDADVFRQFVSQTGSRIMSQAAERFIQHKQRQKELGLSDADGKAIDNLESVQRLCDHMTSKAKPIKQLHKRFDQIKEEILADGGVVPEDWISDWPLQHFGSREAIFLLFNLDHSGESISKALIHRYALKWRILAVFECDKKLDEMRSNFKPADIDRKLQEYTNRPLGSRTNKFDEKLTAPQVEECMIAADNIYWDFQKKMGAPITEPTTSLQVYHSAVMDSPSSPRKKQRVASVAKKSDPCLVCRKPTNDSLEECHGCPRKACQKCIKKYFKTCQDCDELFCVSCYQNANHRKECGGKKPCSKPGGGQAGSD